MCWTILHSTPFHNCAQWIYIGWIYSGWIFNGWIYNGWIYNGYKTITSKLNIQKQDKINTCHKINPALIRNTDNSLLKLWKHLKSHKSEWHFSQVNLITINENTDSQKIGFLELMPFQAQRHQWGDCMK